MRIAKALIHSLGTGTSLVCGAVCVLGFASAVVAFQGWPGTDLPQVGGPVVLTSAPERDRRTGGRETAVVLAAPVPRGSTLTAAGSGSSSATVATRGVGAVAGGSESRPGDGGTGTQAGTGTALPPATTPTSAPSGGSSGAPASGSADPVGDTLRKTTGGVSETVRGVGNTAAPVLDKVVPGSGQTAEQLTDGVGDVVDGLLPSR